MVLLSGTAPEFTAYQAIVLLLNYRSVAEGEGIEPLTLRSPWFSGPVADHSAAPSVTKILRAVGFEPTPVHVLSVLPLPLGYARMVRERRLERLLDRV